jgi:hypothetical protein
MADRHHTRRRERDGEGTVMNTEQSAFDPQAMTAVIGHMNGHHRDDCILIARAFGELDEVRDAVMVDIDLEGARFTAVTDTGAQDVVVPWAREMKVRPDLRDEMARMYRDACHALGVTPRQGES